MYTKLFHVADDVYYAANNTTPNVFYRVYVRPEPVGEDAYPADRQELLGYYNSLLADGALSKFQQLFIERYL
jgi:hypothetical protein